MQLEKLGRWIKATPETLPKEKGWYWCKVQDSRGNIYKLPFERGEFASSATVLYWLDEQEGYFLTKEEYEVFQGCVKVINKIADFPTPSNETELWSWYLAARMEVGEAAIQLKEI